MRFVAPRLRAFESLWDSFVYSLNGLELTSQTHRWIFWYRLRHGRYPSNAEIANARRRM